MAPAAFQKSLVLGRLKKGRWSSSTYLSDPSKSEHKACFEDGVPGALKDYLEGIEQHCSLKLPSLRLKYQ